MALFNIAVWKKNAVNQGRPIWENTVTAGDVEEAYQLGKSQFEAERPEIQREEVTIEASGFSPEEEF